MMLLWVIPVVFLVYFLVAGKNRLGTGWNWALVAVVGLPLVGMLFMGRYGGRGMMDGRGMMGGRMMQGWRTGGAPAVAAASPAFFWVRAALCVVVVVGLLVLAYFAIKRFSAALPAEDEAVRELRLRLARGEITAEEFDVRLAKLNQK